jgi:hypothetical protein
VECKINAKDREYLRTLASRQAEYAALPIMREREENWFRLNDGRGAVPPIMIEAGSFSRDFMPESIFKFPPGPLRGMEYQLLANIRCHELIDDDRVIPDTFDIGWNVKFDEFGIKINVERVPDNQGYSMGFKVDHPIKDIKEDLNILNRAKCSVDREATYETKTFVESIIGDILPVKIRAGVFGCMMLTGKVIELMGMEAYFMAMYDYPEELHRLMAFLRDNALQVMRWGEKENLYTLNNRNQMGCFGSSSNFTNKLPSPGFDGKQVRLCDMWANSNSQETVGVSPELFHEFCFPYYKDVCEPLGLLYYGCCEPTHPFWGDLSRLPHLKKISISRWCDQKFMGEALKGTGIVFSRKMDPQFIGVDVKLKEEAWAAHIKETLEAAPGVAIEFIYRDVYTVHGDLDKVKRAVKIAREVIAKNYR